MRTNTDFSIVFPVMNQEDHIKKVIRAYHRELTKNKISFELIAVVNCTKDKSFEVCQKVAKEMLHVSCYKLHGCGYGLGILHGLKRARGKYLCYASSARTYADELVLCLKYFLVNQNIIIQGVRKRRDLAIRRLGAVIYDTTCKMLFRISSSDINGIPKVFSLEIYEKLDLQFTDSMIDLELVEKAKKLDIPIIEVPIYKNLRHGGRSTSTYKTIFRLMKEVISYWIATRITNTRGWFLLWGW